jgi:uncharacterized Fe-S cluster protein YjdI
MLNNHALNGITTLQFGNKAIKIFLMLNNNREYSNGEIKVFWKPSLCIHSTICFSELPEVFKPGRRPWVEIYSASTDKIIEVVNRCPTSALSWEKVEKSKEIDKEVKVKVEFIKNGPICISGSFEIVDEDGILTNNNKKVSLCRCRKSGNMPFCDGSHVYID